MEIDMGLFGPSKADLQRAAERDARAERLEGQARQLGVTADHHRRESRRTDAYADPAADRVAARDAECDRESAALEAGHYRSSATRARTRWGRS